MPRVSPAQLKSRLSNKAEIRRADESRSRHRTIERWRRTKASHRSPSLAIRMHPFIAIVSLGAGADAILNGSGKGLCAEMGAR